MRSVWHDMPRRSFTLILAAVFMTFLPIGFLSDVYSLGANSPGRLALVATFSGCMAVGYLYSIRLNRRLLPIVIAIQLAFTLLPTGAPFMQLHEAATGRALRARLALDAVASGASTIIAYACFMMFFRREGARYFRAHAEIEFAHAIHQLLVPRIDTRIGRFEFYGASLPSGEVGGDLVDLVETGGRWIAYIADVSGHGVGSGVLMGMVKSAARMKLLTLASPAALLDDLNDALVPVPRQYCVRPKSLTSPWPVGTLRAMRAIKTDAALQSPSATRLDLLLETLALRHQLGVLARSHKRFRSTDRLFWLFLRWFWPRWREALLLTRPATVDRWHRGRFDWRWWQRSRRPGRAGRPRIDSQVRDLIGRLADENRLWGAPRIHGELLKLGIVVSERTVSRYLRGRPRTSSQTWRTFLANQLGQMTFISELPSSYALGDDAVDACARSCHLTPSSDCRCASTTCSLLDWLAPVRRTCLGSHFTQDHVRDRTCMRRSTGRAPPRNVRAVTVRLSRAGCSSTPRSDFGTENRIEPICHARREIANRPW